ncbi:MAG TPA: polysaccharide deacetylase family protein [Flavisolibacter sp.]|nr:polysaccharide deacetylase family protein [Flavisolibacter sp.]
MKRIAYFQFCFLLICTITQAQTSTTWNGKGCAVVLTYDDGLNTDLKNVIPALDSFGLKGTFYISDYFNGLNAQISGWRTAAAHGHELANHTIWHACEGGRTGREFVSHDYDLRFYTVRRMTDEIKAMNNILKAIDGKSERTFAYPCGDTKIHDTAYIEGLKNDFIAARGVRPEMPAIDQVNLFNVGCYTINGQSGEELISLVRQAMQKHTLIVFLFHGVGGEHTLNVSLAAHHRLLQFLKDAQQEIWVAPMVNVARFIKNYQSLKQ